MTTVMVTATTTRTQGAVKKNPLPLRSGGRLRPPAAASLPSSSRRICARRFISSACDQYGTAARRQRGGLFGPRLRQGRFHQSEFATGGVVKLSRGKVAAKTFHHRSPIDYQTKRQSTGQGQIRLTSQDLHLCLTQVTEQNQRASKQPDEQQYNDARPKKTPGFMASGTVAALFAPSLKAHECQRANATAPSALCTW